MDVWSAKDGELDWKIKINDAVNAATTPLEQKLSREVSDSSHRLKATKQ
jgi:hypothetical protein